MSEECGADNTDIYAICAYIGGGMLAIGPLYQTYKMYQKKQTRDVSLKWSINYITGLILVSLFSLVNNIWPILIGEAIELFNMLMLTIYKVYIEKKFLCIDFGGRPIVHEISLNEFKKAIVSDSITLSLTNEELDDILDKSNDEDDVFALRFTLKQLKNMVKKIESNKNKNTNVDFRELHLQLHDSDNEDEPLDSVAIIHTDGNVQVMEFDNDE